jgi:hypothetical protein
MSKVIFYQWYSSGRSACDAFENAKPASRRRFEAGAAAKPAQNFQINPARERA